MKNTLLITSLFFVAILVASPAQAQDQERTKAWEKNSRVLSIGIGASQFYHIDDYYHGNRGDFNNGIRGNSHRWYNPMTGQFNFQAEFGVHKYVGIGFTTGFGGRSGWARSYRGEINMPIGFVANYHFYQLIADKSSKNIHSDKLDIYGGLSLGSGVAVSFYRDNNLDNDVRRVVPLIFGGPHVGIRYYFKPNVGVNAELGWGRSLVNVGLVFKR